MPDKCPDCGADCEHDEVDIGVGIQQGPPYCPDCGWHPPSAYFEIEESEE